MPPSNSSKSSGSSKRSTRSRPSPARKAAGARRAADAETSREQLQRLLDPREVVVVSRSRLQAALDDAVERGRMTRDDAGALLTELLSDSADRVRREVDRARRAAGVGGSFPISGYDDLTAAQVVERLGDLGAAELRKVRDYEKRNANRKSVLAAVEKKLQ
jgi:hypothetical protein